MADFGDDGSEYGEEDQMSPEEKDRLLLEAVKDGDVEKVNEMLMKQASPSSEKDGWNPLLWASCNGNEEIVRLLIKASAHTQYTNMSHDNEGQDKNIYDDGNNDPFVKPKDAQKVGRYTPLHWASYKGHYKVVWILLNAGLSPLDIDPHGNTAIHHAASDANGLKVLKCFLSRGCDLGMKNARGHTPLDLATTQETRDLINRALKTSKCHKGIKCGGSKFDFKNVRYRCDACSNFFSGQCTWQGQYYENAESDIKERPVTFSLTCLAEIQKAEKEIQEAMDTKDFHILHKVLSGILAANVDINPKLRREAEDLHLKLEMELDIRNFIASVAHVDNYKTILKS